MSDQEIGRKMVEQVELSYFLDAYEHVTGERLSLIRSGERPDFICKRPCRSQVGVELTKVMRDPKSASWDQILYYQEYMSDSKAFRCIFKQLDRKERGRIQIDWLHPEDTILVLQLVDYPISEMKLLFDLSLQPDFASYGFLEIWAADYTEIEAYGDVELFGLHPLKWWGYHQRPNPDRKPYG